MKQQLLKIILLSSSLLGLMSCNGLKPTGGNSMLKQWKLMANYFNKQLIY